MEEPYVIVSGLELNKALFSLTVAAKGKTPPDLVLFSQQGRLILKVGGSSVSISAIGGLAEQCRLSGKIVMNLKRFIPKENEVRIYPLNGFIGFGNMRFSCVWEKPVLRLIQIPINASLGHILGIWQRYSDEEIEKSGFLNIFQAADNERVSRIDEAMKLLAPFGVTHEELVKLVDGAIIRVNQENFPDLPE